MKAYGYIYIHRNKENGHVYIGQSTQEPERRFRKGAKALNAYKTCPAMYAALQKYGWEGFETEILVWAKTQELLNLLEEKYINEYQSADGTHGYNSNWFSEGRGKQSESTKEKIRQIQLEFNRKQREMGIVKIAPNRKEHVFIDGIESKHCTGCDQIKPIIEFNSYASRWDGLHNKCAACQRLVRSKQYSKERKPLTPEEMKQSYVDRAAAISLGQQKSRQNNPESALGGKKNAKSIVAVDINTGEIQRFSSALAAKREKGYDNTNISLAIKNETVYRNCRWRFDK